MATVLQHVLSTPLDIFQATQHYFPNVQATLEGSPQDPVMTLTLDPYVEPFRVTHAVDRTVFLGRIKEVCHIVQLKRTSFCPQQSIRLSLTNAFLTSRLSEYYRFQRIMYEKGGQKCLDLILSFLSNPNMQNTQLLTQLGLASNQIDQDPKDNDFAYFVSLTDLIGRMPPGNKGPIVRNFQIHYPNISKRIFAAAFQQGVQQEKQKPDIYQKILEELKKSVCGQEFAVQEMASTLTSQKKMNSNKVYLFVGPSGVGKTELAKAAAKIKEFFITIPMNQYSSESKVSDFFGSAPGYVGSTDKSHLAKEFDKCNPKPEGKDGSTEIVGIENTVILFDEFEKANPTIKQGLLTLFDEGICKLNYTSNSGHINHTILYKLRRCVIINTSNLYQESILDDFHQGVKIDQIAKKFNELNATYPIHNSFSQELLGRMQVIPFGPIPRGECYQKLLKMKLADFMAELRKEYAFKEIDLEQEAVVLSVLENKLYGRGTNIRSVAQYFSRIKTLINQNQSNWGALKNVRLVFSNREGELFLKILAFIENFEIYHDPNIAIRLP